ncbi:MAG TPA: zf-HC2 domain-containing protein [Blastocatellia bacterium]|nr:zf-HC2 domain-containing protein [Blastocatellia bacterium]
MKCQDFSLLISAQLDGRLSAGERLRLEEHLSECPFCRHTADEMAGLRGELRQLRPQLPSPEMAADIMTVLQMEARIQARASWTRRDRLEALRIRIFAHGIGLVISCGLLLFLSLEILRPIHRTMAIAQALAETAISEDSNRFNELSNLLLPPPPTRPNFSPSGTLLGFSESSPEGEFIVTVVVDKNGRASIKEVVEPPSDTAMINRLSDVLIHQASFSPARREGKYIIADAVLMFCKVNIQG